MNPLTLPELRMLIGRFLATADLLSCILVCQAWHQDYKLLLYRSIRLDEPTLRLVPRETLRKHAHLFRNLVIMEPMRLSFASIGAWGYPARLGNTACMTSSYWATISTVAEPLPFTPQSVHKSEASSFSLPHPTTPNPAPISFNLLSLDIHPSISFRKHIHDQVPRHKVLIVGTDQYDIMNDDFWCLQSTDACIRLIQLNPNLYSLTESWDDMSSFHRVRFANQLCLLKNRLVKLHLSKWEVTIETLNQLIENSPMLEFLRFSKLIVKKKTGLAVGLRDDILQQNNKSTIPALVINFRQLKVFSVSHASIQIRDLNIEAPSLIALSVSFGKVNFTQPNSYNTSISSRPYGYSHAPKVLWNTPRLERVICNRTEESIASPTLFETPHTLRVVSIANYEIESRLISQFVTAQGLQLESIRLACFSGITARDIRLILTRCPNLINLYAPEIMMWAGDLFAVQAGDSNIKYSTSTESIPKRIDDWACRKLERLSLYVCLDASAVDDISGFHEYSNQQQYSFSKAASSSLEPTFNCPMEIEKAAQQHQQYQQQDWQKPMQPQGQILYPQDSQQDHHQHRQHHLDFDIHIRNTLLDQLANLTRLRHLDLSGEHVEKVDNFQIGLPWTLHSGLQKLGSLQSLEHVAVTGWIDDMGVPEVEWMKQSWPNLRRISLLKTNIASMSRFKNLVGETWPALTVQDKNRNNAQCTPLYLY
ncbi:hypothetical protein BGX27_002188 [Mortierella sp. AM989]|nr:hypothetical protein BGX27_002188 [Mortierella sp. AM989]